MSKKEAKGAWRRAKGKEAKRVKGQRQLVELVDQLVGYWLKHVQGST